MQQTRTATHALGFESAERELTLDALELRGELPRWLRGSVIRTGPAKWDLARARMRHWFDGLAMLHRFTIDDGRVSYASRFLRTEAYRRASEDGRPGLREFATDPCRSLFKRVMSVFDPEVTDNCAVNLARVGERFVAMTETPIAVEFDPRTLATVGVAERPPGDVAIAHPHHDRETGELVSYAVNLHGRPSYRIYSQAAGGRPRTIGSVPVSRPSYMHSFGMTERYAVLAELPLVVNPLRLAFGDRPFIENYEWRPERGTRFLVIDRRSGRLVRRVSAEPFFCFHHVNAWEEGDDVVVDLCALPDAEMIDAFYLDRLRQPEPLVPLARVKRYRLAAGADETTGEAVGDEPLELPRIDYTRRNARPYQYVWGVGHADRGDGERARGWMDSIVKLDAGTGEALKWHEPGCHPGEPLLARDPDGRAEDDGVLLSVVLDAERGGSSLLVLDARTLEEVARALLPQPVPFGFHGQYFRDEP